MKTCVVIAVVRAFMYVYAILRRKSRFWLQSRAVKFELADLRLLFAATMGDDTMFANANDLTPLYMRDKTTQIEYELVRVVFSLSCCRARAPALSCARSHRATRARSIIWRACRCAKSCQRRHCNAPRKVMCSAR